MEKTAKYAWLALAIVTAILIPIYGAWHHLFTVGISILMYAMHGEEKPEEEKEPAEDTSE